MMRAESAKGLAAGRNALLEENERLRSLVVTLATVALRNIVNVERAVSLSDGTEMKTAEVLEAAGHELMMQAAAMKSALRREGRRQDFARN